MGWALLLIATAIAAYKLRRVRFAVAGVAGLAILLVGGVVGSVTLEDWASVRRVEASDIDVDGTLLRRGSSTVSSSHVFAGRIRNRSQYEISSVTIKIQVRECIAHSCEIIKEANTWISERVPPGQARDFEAYVPGFNSLDWQSGLLSWDWSIEKIRASKP